MNYKIPTDITFTDLDVDLDKEFDYVKNTKKLRKDYIKKSYLKSQNIVLIAFDENNKFYTILTFFYNIFEDCIEVDAFWSNDNIPGGGSIMMNFLINAVKCGINLCDDPRIYTRKIILSSVHDPATINFYKNFKFIEIKENTSKPTYLVPFTRNLSTGSADLNDEANVLNDFDIFYRELEENKNNIERLNNKLQNLNKDLQYLSNTTTIREIETTKNEIKDLRERQIQILDKLTELEESHIEFMSKFYSLLENKEILDKITFTKRDYKKLDFRKLINTIKETSDNDDFFKLVKQYLNKNTYYHGMEIERVLTGVFYEIKDEKKIIKNIKKLKEKEESILTGKEGSGGSRRTRRRRNKSNKRNKSKKKNH